MQRYLKKLVWEGMPIRVSGLVFRRHATAVGAAEFHRQLAAMPNLSRRSIIIRNYFPGTSAHSYEPCRSRVVSILQEPNLLLPSGRQHREVCKAAGCRHCARPAPQAQ